MSKNKRNLGPLGARRTPLVRLLRAPVLSNLIHRTQRGSFNG